MCPDRRLKRTFALLEATLDPVQGLFSIRRTKRIAPFSERMRLWRHTALSQSRFSARLAKLSLKDFVAFRVGMNAWETSIRKALIKGLQTAARRTILLQFWYSNRKWSGVATATHWLKNTCKSTPTIRTHDHLPLEQVLSRSNKCLI